MAKSMQMTEELDDCFVKTAANIMKYYGNETEGKNMMNQLRDALKENCIESTKMMTADEIKDRLTSMLELEPKRSVEDIIKEYKEAVSKIQVNPSENSRLMQYDRQIGDLQMNQSTTSKELDDTDSDLRLTCQDVNIIDPISKTRIIDPVRNTICGHVYDRGNLVAMLQRNKKTRCPVVGCTSKDYIDLNQCRIDIVTKMYLEKHPA